MLLGSFKSEWIWIAFLVRKIRPRTWAWLLGAASARAARRTREPLRKANANGPEMGLVDTVVLCVFFKLLVHIISRHVIYTYIYYYIIIY